MTASWEISLCCPEAVYWSKHRPWVPSGLQLTSLISAVGSPSSHSHAQGRDPWMATYVSQFAGD